MHICKISVIIDFNMPDILQAVLDSETITLKKCAVSGGDML